MDVEPSVMSNELFHKHLRGLWAVVAEHEHVRVRTRAAVCEVVGGGPSNAFYLDAS